MEKVGAKVAQLCVGKVGTKITLLYQRIKRSAGRRLDSMLVGVYRVCCEAFVLVGVCAGRRLESTLYAVRRWGW